MPLTTAEREAFLAEPHVAALSVVAGPGRGPLTVPVWYDYTPGGELWVLTGATSRKIELIRRAGRFTIMVERVSPTIRYVAVEGPVTSIVPGTVDHLRKVSTRYLPPEKVDGYMEMALAEHGEQVVVHMRPEHWLSSDLGTI